MFSCFLLCHCFQGFNTCTLRFTFELRYCFHKAFHLLTFYFHRHHLTLWFLFFISIASCDYTLVFIKLKNQGLRVFVFVSICVVVSFKLSSCSSVCFDLQFVSTTMCFRHLHQVQLVFGCSSPSPLHLSDNSLVCVWIMLFVLNNFYFVVCAFMFALCCLHLLFCSCFASCFAFCYFAIPFCILLALCWNVLFFMIYSSRFVFCWNIYCSIVFTLLKYFLFWCYHSIEAFIALLKHFALWCLCFVKCYVTIFSTLVLMFHTLLFVFHCLVLCSASPSSSALLHLSMFSCFCFHLHVFICSFSWWFLFSYYVCRKWKICRMKQSPKFMPWLTLLLNNILVASWMTWMTWIFVVLPLH